MTTHKRVMEFIKLIKGPTPLELFELDSYENPQAKTLKLTEWDTCDKIMEEIFMSGNCGSFARILKFVFPSTEFIVIKKQNGERRSHVVSKIEGRYYDIQGEYDFSQVEEFIKVKDEKELFDLDYFPNYSFQTRGPIV